MSYVVVRRRGRGGRSVQKGDRVYRGRAGGGMMNACFYEIRADVGGGIEGFW